MSVYTGPLSYMRTAPCSPTDLSDILTMFVGPGKASAKEFDVHLDTGSYE